MSDKQPLPVRQPQQNGPVVGGEHMPVPHAEPVPDTQSGTTQE